MRCFCHNDTVKYRFMKLSWVQYDMQHQLCKYFLEKGKQVIFIYTKQECAGLYKKKKKWSSSSKNMYRFSKNKSRWWAITTWEIQMWAAKSLEATNPAVSFLFLCSKKQLIYFPNTLLSKSLHGLTTNYAQIL